MAGALGFEPRNFLIQSQAPYQLGHAPATGLGWDSLSKGRRKFSMAKRTMSEGVLALDIGTSSVRAVVYDARGRMLESTLCDLPYKVQTTQPGEVSSSPDALVKLVAQTIDGALRTAHKERIHILAVATSCYWHSLMGIDSAGRPTTEVLTWADTRSAADTRWLRTHADERQYHRRTGCFFHASYWPAKLRWLRSTRSAAVRRTVRWISLGEYLYKTLFGGELAVSLSMASATGLLDVNRCVWDAAALRLARIRKAQLSRLTDWDEPARGLRPSFARRWPPLRQIPWYQPVGDGGLANIGAAALNPRWACATIGTSGALRVIVEKPRLRIPWGAFVYRLDRRRFVVGGALSEGGNVVRWFTDRLGLDRGLEKTVVAVQPDAHGLTVLPFWAGERSPNWRGDARAVIAGLSLSTTGAQLLRATMEAIAFQFATVAEAIERTIARPSAIVGTGGQLVHSPVWAQLLADVVELPVMVSPAVEASSRGAALLALHAEGHLSGLWSLAPPRGRQYRPRPAVSRVYRQARERQQRLYDLLFPPLGHPEHASLIASAESGSRRKGLRSPAAKH